MKRIYFLFVLVFFLFNCSSNKSEGQEQNSTNPGKKEVAYEIPEDISLWFIGYLNQFPVFNNINGNELYISKKTGTIELYQKYEEGTKPRFINDEGIVFFNRNNNTLIIKYFNNKEKVIELEDYPLYLVGTDNLETLYYQNKEGYLKKLDTKSGTFTKSDFKGSVPQLGNNELFFDTSISEFAPGLNINKVGLDLKNPETVLKNVNGDPWVLGNNRYIVCLPFEMQDKLSIYDLEKKTYKVVEGVKSGTWSYYSYQENGIVFYDPNTFETKVVKL